MAGRETGVPVHPVSIRAFVKPPPRRPCVVAASTPSTTLVVAPAAGDPWQIRQSETSSGAAMSISPWAVCARWQPAHESAVKVVDPLLTLATCGPPSAAAGAATSHSAAMTASPPPAATRRNPSFNDQPSRWRTPTDGIMRRWPNQSVERYRREATAPCVRLYLAAYPSPSRIRRRIGIGGAPWAMTASRCARSSKPGVAG